MVEDHFDNRFKTAINSALFTGLRLFIMKNQAEEIYFPDSDRQIYYPIFLYGDHVFMALDRCLSYEGIHPDNEFEPCITIGYLQKFPPEPFPWFADYICSDDYIPLIFIFKTFTRFSYQLKEALEIYKTHYWKNNINYDPTDEDY